MLVFERGGYLSPAAIDEFAAALGVATNTLTSVERSRPEYIPLETVIRLNPYPQVLRTEDDPYWLSVGYRSTDARYHQITWYGGESDTTPSLLVKKVTPRATGWGDYFVRYTVALSKETPAHPGQIEALQWQSYRGGSYDGFEEMGFTFLGTLLLAPGLARCTLVLMCRRRRIQLREVMP